MVLVPTQATIFKVILSEVLRMKIKQTLFDNLSSKGPFRISRVRGSSNNSVHGLISVKMLVTSQCFHAPGAQ